MLCRYVYYGKICLFNFVESQEFRQIEIINVCGKQGFLRTIHLTSPWNICVYLSKLIEEQRSSIQTDKELAAMISKWDKLTEFRY